MKPGDVVALAATTLGFRKCASCEQRRLAMNAVDTSKSILEIAADLAAMVIKPTAVVELVPVVVVPTALIELVKDFDPSDRLSP